MKLQYVPLLSSLTCLAIFFSLWLYAFCTTTGLPAGVVQMIFLLLFSLSIIGIGTTVRLPIKTLTRVVYLIAMVFVLLGFGSFYVFREPTTINIFGLLAIITGLMVANVIGLIFALNDHLKR